MALLIKYGIFGIMFAGLAEAILLPMPMEVVSVPVYLANTSQAFLLSIVLVICSVIGSMIGYQIAHSFGGIFLKKVEDMKAVQKVNAWYERNAVVTLLTSAVSPIPYEIYVVSAGLCGIKRKRFMVGCILSRMLRHLPQGIIITFGGNELLGLLKDRLAIVVTCIVAFVFVRWLLNRKIKTTE